MQFVRCCADSYECEYTLRTTVQCSQKQCTCLKYRNQDVQDMGFVSFAFVESAVLFIVVVVVVDYGVYAAIASVD